MSLQELDRDSEETLFYRVLVPLNPSMTNETLCNSNFCTTYRIRIDGVFANAVLVINVGR